MEEQQSCSSDHHGPSITLVDFNECDLSQGQGQGQVECMVYISTGTAAPTFTCLSSAILDFFRPGATDLLLRSVLLHMADVDDIHQSFRSGHSILFDI